jgi:hypothetical protein
MSVQNILLGNGSERDFDGLNLDSTSEAVLAFPHGNSKREEHILDVVWREVWAPLVEWEESAMIFPRTPVAFAHSTVHCRSSNCFPRNVSKTLDFSLMGTIANCHACCSGKGNVVSKAETKSWSDKTGCSDLNNACALEGRDAMSAMVLSFPGT